MWLSWYNLFFGTEMEDVLLPSCSYCLKASLIEGGLERGRERERKGHRE